MSVEPRPDRAFWELSLIRIFEETCLTLKQEGEIPGSIHLCIGQEAIPVGACSALEPDDAVTATYRGHGWALARGSDPAQMFAEMMGKASTLSGGRGGSPFFSDASVNFLGENSIVGAGVPIALGAAVDAWQRNRSCVSIVSIGDGALNQGATQEALNFASAFALPLIVVVENNVYSEMTPWRNLTAITELTERARGYAMAAVQVDGNDVWAVAEAVTLARDNALDGRGPTFIEAQTERLVGHYSGDVQAYRPPGEVEDARSREPLAVFRQHAGRRWPDTHFDYDHLDAEVRQTIDSAVDEARALPSPDAETLLDHLYA